jgi:transposase
MATTRTSGAARAPTRLRSAAIDALASRPEAVSRSGSDRSRAGVARTTGASNAIPSAEEERHDKYRRELRRRGIGSEIARRKTEHGSGLGRVRWVVERTFAWLHHHKRLLVRYDRRADIHEAFLALACCLVCFRRPQPSF